MICAKEEEAKIMGERRSNPSNSYILYLFYLLVDSEGLLHDAVMSLLSTKAPSSAPPPRTPKNPFPFVDSLHRPLASLQLPHPRADPWSL